MGPIYSSRNSAGDGRRFSTLAECAAAWVRQRDSNGYVSGNRMFFDNEVIYSWRRSWPLARLIYGKGDVAYVLLNIEHTTASTRNHLSLVRREITSYFGEAHTIFEVDGATLNASDDREAVYQFYSAKLKAALGSEEKFYTGKARLAPQPDVEAALRATEAGNRFASIFGDAVPFPTNTSEALALAMHESTREAA